MTTEHELLLNETDPHLRAFGSVVSILPDGGEFVAVVDNLPSPEQDIRQMRHNWVMHLPESRVPDSVRNDRNVRLSVNGSTFTKSAGYTKDFGGWVMYQLTDVSK